MSLQNPIDLALTIPSAASSTSNSPNSMLHVVEFTPTEGERGVPIHVRLHFNHNSTDSIYLRLVVGTKALATEVHELPEASYGKWKLHAIAPAFNDFGSDKVPLTVQALTKDNQVLESVTFGEFQYWVPNGKHHSNSQHDHKRQNSVDSPASSGNATLISRRRASTTTSSTVPNFRSDSPRTRGVKKEGSRRIRANSLMRAKYPISKEIDGDLYAQTPLLQLITSLDAMTVAWEPEEEVAGRRLVKFTKVQDGRKLIVSCESVSQEDFRECDSVISCIHRDDNQTYYVTSVDIIYLLERLTNEEFPVEEKNRIRRNLEGLRPTTVSKHKPGFEQFFQRIMEFPDPKPRNIEKDLKVFEWSLLGQALEKILSKYHVYTSSSPTDSTVSLPVSPSDDTSSYGFTDHQVQNNKSDGYPELVHPAPIVGMKFEPLYDDRSLLFLHQPQHDHLDSLSHSTVPFMYNGSNGKATPEKQTHHSSDDDVLNGHWTPPERMSSSGELGIGDYRHLSDFHLAETSEAAHNADDLSPYNTTYHFPGISEPLVHFNY